MTRIRYKKDRLKNCLFSVKPILCNNKFTEIVIDLNSMEWKIYDAESKDVLLSGINNTLTKIKKDVKIATMKLGATYYSEVKGRRLII